MIFVLSHAQARARAVEYVKNAPDGHIVRISEPTRSGEQNAKLHALLTEISQSQEWAGRKWDVETWKRLLVAAWTRATGGQGIVLPALDGMGVDVVFRRTSQLSKAECSELITFIEAWQQEKA